MREMANECDVALGFAAEHEVPPSRIKPVLSVAAIGNAAVDPERQLRVRRPQPRQREAIVSPALDGIEIRDIERREGMHREEPARHIDGIAARRQRSLDRAILRPPPHPGANHDALLEIDDRNNLHGYVPFRAAMTRGYESITVMARNGTCVA